MTRSRPFSPALALAGGLAIAASLVGCSANPPDAVATKYPFDGERKVVIPVIVDETGNVVEILDPASDDATSHGRQAAVSKKGGHHLRWRLSPEDPDVALTVEIKKDFPDPFDKKIDCSGGKECKSGKVRIDVDPGTPAKPYTTQYNIIVTKRGSKAAVVKDPVIRVDP